MLEPRRNPPPSAVFDAGQQGEAARVAYGQHFADLMSREWNSIGIHLAYSYAHSPLCAPDPEAMHTDSVTSYVQTSAPGSRAPHVWLSDGRSTLDWFGRGFVLVQTDGPSDLSRELVLAALVQGVPLTVQRTASRAVAQAYERALVLVRPDGHVAWRSDDGPTPEQAHAIIGQVRGAPMAATATTATSSKEVAV